LAYPYNPFSLTTIRNADRILVLEAGQIVEQGTPEELMAKPEGKYFKMYTDQRLDIMAQLPQSKSAAQLVGKYSMHGAQDLANGLVGLSLK